MPLRSFPDPDLGLPAEARDEIARAVDQIHLADETLAGLQDSMLPVEVGDPELRAGLSEVRSLIGWTQLQDELLQQEGLADEWLVLGQRNEVEDRLQVQRTWLRGADTGRYALILTFAHGNKAPFSGLLTMAVSFAGA